MMDPNAVGWRASHPRRIISRHRSRNRLGDMTKKHARSIMQGLLHDGLDLTRLSSAGRLDLQEAVDAVLADCLGDGRAPVSDTE